MLIQLKTKPLKLYYNLKREQIVAIDLFYYVLQVFPSSFSWFSRYKCKIILYTAMVVMLQIATSE